MREMFILTAHLLVTLAKLARPGGFRVVAAESLAVKHQLLIMKRSRQRAPNLTSWDRLALGFCALLVSRERLNEDGRDIEGFHPYVLSPSPGEAQYLPSL